MALTRNFKKTVIQRVQSDASFAQALLDEAATLFLNGDVQRCELPQLLVRVTEDGPKRGICCYIVQVSINHRNGYA